MIAAIDAGWVVYQANAGAPQVWVPKWTIGGGVAAAFIGLLGIVFGPKATSIFENMNKGIIEVKWHEWLAVIGTGVVGAYCYHIVIGYLECAVIV